MGRQRQFQQRSSKSSIVSAQHTKAQQWERLNRALEDNDDSALSKLIDELSGPDIMEWMRNSTPKSDGRILLSKVYLANKKAYEKLCLSIVTSYRYIWTESQHAENAASISTLVNYILKDSEEVLLIWLESFAQRSQIPLADAVEHIKNQLGPFNIPQKSSQEMLDVVDQLNEQGELAKKKLDDLLLNLAADYHVALEGDASSFIDSILFDSIPTISWGVSNPYYPLALDEYFKKLLPAQHDKQNFIERKCEAFAKLIYVVNTTNSNIIDCLKTTGVFGNSFLYHEKIHQALVTLDKTQNLARNYHKQFCSPASAQPQHTPSRVGPAPPKATTPDQNSLVAKFSSSEFFRLSEEEAVCLKNNLATIMGSLKKRRFHFGHNQTQTAPNKNKPSSVQLLALLKADTTAQFSKTLLDTGWLWGPRWANIFKTDPVAYRDALIILSQHIQNAEPNSDDKKRLIAAFNKITNAIKQGTLNQYHLAILAEQKSPVLNALLFGQDNGQVVVEKSVKSRWSIRRFCRGHSIQPSVDMTSPERAPLDSSQPTSPTPILIGPPETPAQATLAIATPQNLDGTDDRDHSGKTAATAQENPIASSQNHAPTPQPTEAAAVAPAQPPATTPPDDSNITSHVAVATLIAVGEHSSNAIFAAPIPNTPVGAMDFLSGGLTYADFHPTSRPPAHDEQVATLERPLSMTEMAAIQGLNGHLSLPPTSPAQSPPPPHKEFTL